MVPVVGLFRCPSACPDLGAFFRGIFLGHIGGHVEQNSVCRDTNAVDERNQPHLVFWLYFITFLQYFPLFFRISLPPWGAACPVGYCVPFGWSGLFRCLGAQRPVGRLPGGGPRFSRETGGKRARGERFSPLDSLLWFGGPCGDPLFFSAWPAALYLTPVTARPLAGRAGKGRNFGTRCAGLPKLGDAPRPAPAKLALSG